MEKKVRLLLFTGLLLSNLGVLSAQLYTIEKIAVGKFLVYFPYKKFGYVTPCIV